MADRVSEGSVILTLEAEGAAVAAKEKVKEGAAPAPHEGQPNYGSTSGVYDEIEVKVPDIGDFKDVPVIEVHVKAGDTIKPEDPLVTLDPTRRLWTCRRRQGAPSARSASKRATASRRAASSSCCRRGGKTGGAHAARAGTRPAAAPTPRPAAGKADHQAEVLVLGAGPGGYTAAFRAADLGKKVVLVERWPMLGGVCLNVGCIPSKALLHAAKVIDEAHEMGAHGIGSGPQVDVDKLRGWKDGVVKKLVGGLSGLAKARKVTVVTGVGRFSANQLEVENGGAKTLVSFDQAIIAAGSEPLMLPFIPHDDPRVIDSTGALEMDGIPQRLLVIGGGIIGLEMATVLSRARCEGDGRRADGPDHPRRRPRHHHAAHEAHREALREDLPQGEGHEGRGQRERPRSALRGRRRARKRHLRQGAGLGRRRPNGKLIAAENAGVAVDERGFVPVDKQMRTNVPHIFAIGDIVGQPMLAHKATHEGKVAAEVACGRNAVFDARHPVRRLHRPGGGLGRAHRERGQGAGAQVRQGRVPVGGVGTLAVAGARRASPSCCSTRRASASSAAASSGRTPAISSRKPHSPSRWADAADLGHTIHLHPTLSETVAMAAEMFEGTITDLMPPKKKAH